MKILATILSALALTVAAQAENTFHTVTVTGVIQVQAPALSGSGTITLPVKVTNAAIIAQAVKLSGTNKASDFVILLNDQTRAVSLYNKATQEFSTVATSGTGSTDTPTVVGTTKTGTSETFVESGDTVSFTVAFQHSPVTINATVDLLVHVKTTSAGLKSAVLGVVGGGTLDGFPFYYTGVIKTGKVFVPAP